MSATPRRGYSALRHLAWAMWLNHSPARRYMATFAAYFDASGHPDSGTALFVSGFVSSEKKWLKFETEWAALLARYRITPPFHMKEFAPGAGQYAAWKSDKVRRESFLCDAVKLIKRRTNKSFSSGVILDELRRINREYQLPRHMTYPYCLCGVAALVKLGVWAVHQRVSDKIAIVFEDGDKHKGELLNLLHRMEIRMPLSFLPKTASPAFQAADFLAWEHNRLTTDAVRRMGGDPAKPVRGSLIALAAQIPRDGSWGIHDRDALLDHCKRYNFPKRP